MVDVERLVGEAISNPEVKKLLELVESKTEVTVGPSRDAYWSSASRDGQTVIQVADTAHPAEAFYHELLHADLENSGYIPYRVVVTVVPKGLQLPGLLGALDNELQHHRMFGRYMAAGLAPENFYADTDADDFRGVPAKVSELTKGSSPSEALLPFFTIIAPGGVGSEDERSELRSLLKSQCGEETYSKLEEIERAISRWATSADTDPLSTILSVLRSLGEYDGTWVGASPADFPSGRAAFVGRSFTQKDAENFRRIIEQQSRQ